MKWPETRSEERSESRANVTQPLETLHHGKEVDQYGKSRSSRYYLVV